MVPTQTKEVLNPFEVKRMFELDFSEENVKKLAALSQDDRKFLAKVKESIRYDTDGHYEMALPLRDPDVKLPNNRNVALRRLSHLKRKLNIDSRYKEHYMAFMDKVLKSGYAEKVPPASSQNPDHGSRLWYIPHHGVYHPKKPNKIRVVFDCSAEFKGQSLNKHLLQGPDLTNNLTGVLCRFRKEPIAFMCDIEAMFYQVKVTENCRNLLRFLWWEDGDTSKEPQEYRMTVHLFGATSSPGCSNFALKATADDNEIDVGSNPAAFLREDFYVDDGLKSVPSVEEAVKLIKDIKEMCKRGGFNLHKFTSNKKEVIDQIPVEDRAEGIKNLDLDHDALPVERALGVQWCIESDTFKFRITLKDRPCTRRGILSTVSSIFDPLGFVAPLLLDGKIIVQELCKEGADWDDPVPEQVKSRWEQWRTELQVLEKFSIPRCYKPEDFGQVVGTELHHFSDASTKGYGQCSYLRQENDKGQVHCSFVIGKARVTPLKSITVPRLELTAAVVSAKIGELLRKELHIGEIDEVFWTDSKVVLGYIANNSKRFHIFVANRVQQIQDLTSIKQWRYVNTESNPADDASRGLTAHQLFKSRWSNGPEFLWKDKTQWPVETSTVKENQKNDPEVKKVVTMATITAVADDCLLSRLSIFSDWHRAKRALAVCLRYMEKLRERATCRKLQRTSDPRIAVEEMQRAERLIIKAVQAKEFKDSCKKSSSLHQLDPFVDSDGILRVGGRLRRASLTDSNKFPVILPRKSHISNLIIKHYHEQVQHQGRSFTLNEVRSNGYWIVGGTSAVGSYVSSCVTCRKLRGALQEQKMADLPEDRLEPAPPFSNCAVDYFGPWLIKEGRKQVKRYGVLFTCMASRAIHLETPCSLETDSFINALRRFVCRRGPIRQLRSDQGTNFVGAKRELKACLAELDQSKISSELLKINCDWFHFKMNVPSASHMGGVWERQIRSVRNVLSALLQSNGSQLDDESLRTLMCEAESIVNSRPLAIDTLSDPDALNPLTPNHLLT